MIRMALAVAIGAMVVYSPVAFAAEEVAGRPALSTKSTKDLIAQRTKWGTKPTKSSAQ